MHRVARDFKKYVKMHLTFHIEVLSYFRTRKKILRTDRLPHSELHGSLRNLIGPAAGHIVVEVRCIRRISLLVPDLR